MLRKQVQTSELGMSGIRQSGGYIDQEFLKALRGRKGIQHYIEMKDNDPVIGAILFAITMLIRNASWSVVPAGDSPEDLGDAEFIRGCLKDMDPTWDDAVASILSMLWAGFDLEEVVLKKRNGHHADELLTSNFTDGKFGWRSFAGRAQETIQRWIYSEDERHVIGAIQNAPPFHRDVPIPASRYLLFKASPANQNPEGRSILRNAFVPWVRKVRTEEVEGIGLERDLAGLPIIWAPPEIMAPGANAEQKAEYAELQKIATAIRMDEKAGLVFPLDYAEEANQKRYDITLLTTGGRRQYDTSGIINRYDQKIAMTVLGDFILLGHDGVGSFALADEKTNVFGFAIGTFTGSIASVMNRRGIPRLMRLNGMVREKYPTLTPGDVENPNLPELADYLNKLAGTGMQIFPTGDGQLERFLLGLAKLPVPDPVEVD